MELREQILLKKYDATLRAAEDCRKREVALFNYSIVIYGATIAFVLTQLSNNKIASGFISIGLAIVVGIIGLYIAKLNIVERKHLEMEKQVYIDNNISLKDYKDWPLPGLNKFLIWLLYTLLVVFAFILSLCIFINIKDLITNYDHYFKGGLVGTGVTAIICYILYFGDVTFFAVNKKYNDNTFNNSQNIY